MSKKSKENETTTEIAVQGSEKGVELSSSMAQANNLQEKKKYAEMMILSGLLPASLASRAHLEDEDLRDGAIGAVIAVVEYGNELKVSPWTALNNMHVVQGRVVLGINMYLGLATKNNIIVSIIKDYEKVYKDKKLVDFITEIEITRKYPELDNRIMTHKFSKTWTSIRKAGLEEKENYKKMPATMLRTRCTTEALRFYASDVFLGIYEQGEILDAENITYDVDEKGAIIV